MNRSIVLTLCSLVVIAGYAFAADLTMTTYYPSPSGNYDALKANKFTLNPSGQPFLCNSDHLGAIYYSESDNVFYSCNGTWTPLGATAGVWEEAGGLVYFTGTDQSFKVGLGTKAPAVPLHIAISSPGAITGLFAGTGLVIQNDPGNASMSIISSGTTGLSSLDLGSKDVLADGALVYNNSSHALTFQTNTASAMTLDRDKNLTVAHDITAVNNVVANNELCIKTVCKSTWDTASTPGEVMYLQSGQGTGSDPAACPSGWDPVDFKLVYAGDGPYARANNVRTCYTSGACKVMYLQSGQGTGSDPAFCPTGWTPADMQLVYAGDGAYARVNNVRTCYKCAAGGGSGGGGGTGGGTTYTYSWYTGDWSGCPDPACCSGIYQTRPVYCKRSDGASVADAYCSGSRPESSNNYCSNFNGCTYSWSVGSWGSMAYINGVWGWDQCARDVSCVAGTCGVTSSTFPDSNCPSPKPATEKVPCP